MRKLSKRDVEAILVEYDNNPIASLHAALGVLIPNCPAGWEEAVELLPLDEHQRQLLRRRNIESLDALVKLLVETRCL